MCGWSLFCLCASSVASVALLSGCDPDFVIGSWVCAGPSSETQDDDAKVHLAAVPIASPWSTGFENGFCGYSAVDGFCYAKGTSQYRVVTSPVHEGRFAAAFSVNSVDEDDAQTRCVRNGILPPTAYYGAWYFIPTVHANAGNWNLFSFQGRSSMLEMHHILWDLSLVSDEEGAPRLTVVNRITGAKPTLRAVPPIPIGSWFHLEIYLKRAKDATGAVTVYQDGAVALQLTNLVTDDSEWGQLYIGNLATALMPTQSTVYVDDVTISATH